MFYPPSVAQHIFYGGQNVFHLSDDTTIGNVCKEILFGSLFPLEALTLCSHGHARRGSNSAAHFSFRTLWIIYFKG